MNPPEDPRRRAERAARLERIAWLFDDSLRIPGTRIRLGLDALIGLLPGIGDLLGLAVGAWMIVQGARLGAPPALLLRMAGNLGLDALLGAVPGLGDLFDLAFKAHRRNLRLLQAHLGEAPAETPPPPARTAALSGGLLVLLALAALAAWGFFRLS